jgi:hypothetical protein
MPDHTWVVEHLAGYVAGGLDADEREQLEEHVADCADCARALAEVRAADRTLAGLFAGVRPNPDLEDRSIRRLRQMRYRPGVWSFSRRGKIFVAVAAALLLALTGGAVSAVLDEEALGFRGVAQNNLKQIALAYRTEKASKQQSALTGETVTENVNGEAKAKEFRERFEEHAGKLGKKVELFDDTKSFGFGFSTGERTLGTEWYVPAGPPRVPRDGTSNNITFSPDGRKLAAGMGVQPLTPSSKELGRYFRPTDVNGIWSDQDKGKHPPGGTTPPAVRTGGAIPEGERKPPGVDAGKPPTETPPPQDKKPEPTAPAGRKIIRSGDIDFEVNSFDDAVAVISRLVNATKGGFIATINSDKLPNGKVKGSVVVRVPPEQLDRLVLDLRKEIGKAGELKGQRIGSQDVTKQYTDLESRLRAAKTMEERLLKIIRDGKGEIKDLVAAEKELGVWRTRVEEIEGELRYYGSLIALSTLTVNLTEKDIRTAAAIDERERVHAGIEVEDVDAAYREALKAVTEAEGRITKSELKQQKAGQFTALLQFEVEPEKSGPMRDRLKQLGAMARLEIDRVVQAQGGTLTLRDGKTKRGPTQFFVSLYNLANVEPRETQTLKLAAADVPAAFAKLREAVGKANGQVITAQLNQQDRENVTGQLDFHVRRTEEGAVQAALNAAGDVLSRQVGRKPEGENVTDAKVLFKVELIPATAIPPREITTLTLQVTDVDVALTLINAQVKEVEGRTVNAKSGQESNGRTTARVMVDVPLSAKSALVEKLKSLGNVRGQFSERNIQAPEGKFAVARLDVTLSNDVLVPRDEGLWAQVRSGLSFSLRGLSLSVSWLIVGVLFLLPWALVVYAVVWLLRRLWRAEPAPVTATTAPAGGATPETGT